MRKTLYFILILIVGSILWLIFTSDKKIAAPQNDWSSYEQDIEAHNDLILVAEPKIGQLVESKLTIAGQARGFWFFEANFSGEITDQDGNSLMTFPVGTASEWMTEDFVPFRVVIDLPADKIKSGDRLFLILRKDNPSGLPEHEDQISIPLIVK